MSAWELATEMARTAVDKFERLIADRRLLERIERELDEQFRRMLEREPVER